MARFGVVFAAGVVLLAAGVFEVVQARRNADPAAAQVVQARFDAIPLALGDWVGTNETFDPKQIRQTRAVAHVYRVYRRAKTNDIVDILLLAGPAGDIGAHDPERCYGGSGYAQVGTRQRKELVDPILQTTSSYWSARFDAETFPAATVEVNWAWTADGSYAAAADARYEYVGKPILYKVYATRRVTAGGDPKADPAADLLAAFQPELRAAAAAAAGR